MPESMWLLLGAASVVVATRLQRRLWLRGYFGFGELLTGFEYGDRPGWLAVAVKLSIAVIAGAIAAIGSADPVVIGAVGAGAGALALLWPVFLTSEAIPDYVQDRVFELRTIYALFTVTYAALGAVGGWVTQLIGLVAVSPDLMSDLRQVLLDQVSNLVWAGGVIVVSSILNKRQLDQAYSIKEDLRHRTSEPHSGLDYPDRGTTRNDRSV